jgi:hypothetical protein
VSKFGTLKLLDLRGLFCCDRAAGRWGKCLSSIVRRRRQFTPCSRSHHAEHSGTWIDNSIWSTAPYHPTPTIVEAARSLYAQYSIEAIACFDAGAKNLRLISLQGDRRLVRDPLTSKACSAWNGSSTDSPAAGCGMLRTKAPYLNSFARPNDAEPPGVLLHGL